MRYLLPSIGLLLAVVVAVPAYSQQQPARAPRPTLQLDNFVLEDVRMRTAFEMWAAQSGIPLVVNWEALEAEGVDIERPITIELNNVPSMTVLNLMMSYATSDGFGTLVLEGHGSFLEVLTKRQALRRPIIRVYDIRDLLMEVPHFTNAPSFDLQDALSNTNSGGGGTGGGSGSGQGIFGSDTERQQEQVLSRRERGEQIAQLIRDTIEPDIWQAHGGEFASIRYYDGRLIIRAPQYVHGSVRMRL